MVYIERHARVLYCLLAYLHKGAMFSVGKFSVWQKWLQNFMRAHRHTHKKPPQTNEKKIKTKYL